MVKLVFCVRRRAELSREECQRYWRENHAPLVQRHAEVLRVRRYVQTHTLDTPANEMLQPGSAASKRSRAWRVTARPFAACSR